MIRFSADHRQFISRIVQPINARLPNGDIASWVEEQADRLATFGRRRAYVEFSPEYLGQLSASYDAKHYSEISTRGKGPTGNITFSGEESQVMVLRARREEMRAIMAHELGHAVLHQSPIVGAVLSEKRLLVDPGIERLADDVARALLFPRTLAKDYLLTSRSRESWALIPHVARNAAVPYRHAASRLASFILGDQVAAIVCYRAATEHQTDLFPTKTGPVERSVSLKWTMMYQWWGDDVEPRRYLLADRINAARTARLDQGAWDTAKSTEIEPLPSNIVRAIVGPRVWHRLEGFSSFQRCATAREERGTLSFILCT